MIITNITDPMSQILLFRILYSLNENSFENKSEDDDDDSVMFLHPEDREFEKFTFVDKKTVDKQDFGTPKLQRRNKLLVSFTTSHVSSVGPSEAEVVTFQNSRMYKLSTKMDSVSGDILT